MITLDDLGVNDMGYAGGDMEGFTPNIDTLAKEGVTLVNYYGQSMCTPSRATLMSGKFVHRIGFGSQNFDFKEGAGSEIGPYSNFSVPLNSTLLPGYLKRLGYTTYGIGKWNIGHCHESFLPWNRGFDGFLGYLGPGIRYDKGHQTMPALRINRTSHVVSSFYHGRRTEAYDLDDFIEGTTAHGIVALGSSEDVDSDVAFTTRALEVISNVSRAAAHAENSTDDDIDDAASLPLSSNASHPPLFLWLAYHGAHDDVGSDGVSASFLSSSQLTKVSQYLANATSKRQRFARRLMMLDVMIGEVVDALELGGMMENAVVVINSDNGAFPCGTHLSGSNSPFRGGKYHAFEGGLRVPSLVYAPNVLPATTRGARYTGLMHHVDWLKTFIAAAGGSPQMQLDQTLDSCNHWAAIGAATNTTRVNATNGVSPYNPADYNVRSEIIFDISGTGPTQTLSVRSGKYKLLVNVFSEQVRSFDAEDALPFFDCVNTTLGSFLFDLEADPLETSNLYNSHPWIVSELEDRSRFLYNEQVPVGLRSMRSHTVYDTASIDVADDAFLLQTLSSSNSSNSAAYIQPWGCPAGDENYGWG